MNKCIIMKSMIKGAREMELKGESLLGTEYRGDESLNGAFPGETDGQIGMLEFEFEDALRR